MEQGSNGVSPTEKRISERERERERTKESVSESEEKKKQAREPKGEVERASEKEMERETERVCEKERKREREKENEKERERETKKGGEKKKEREREREDEKERERAKRGESERRDERESERKSQREREKPISAKQKPSISKNMFKSGLGSAFSFVWCFAVTWLWFQTCLVADISVGGELFLNKNRRYGFSKEPVWYHSADSFFDEMIKIRVKNSLPTVIAAHLPLDSDVRKKSKWKWLFQHASHVMTRGGNSRTVAFTVIWVHFGPNRCKFDTLPSDKGCSIWIQKHSKRLGFGVDTQSTNQCIPDLVKNGLWTLPRGKTLTPCSKEMEQQLYSSTFVQPFNISELEKFKKLVPDRVLAEKVLVQLREGHRTGHVAPGIDMVFHDWSVESNDEVDNAFQLKTLMKYKDSLFVKGPFDRPPFPNSLNLNQAQINMCFTIPKDKWEAVHVNMARRFIVHGSFPEFLSYNHQLPRLHSGRPGHTCGKFLSRVAELGKNSIVMMMDMKDCFMQFLLNKSEWHRQCVKVGGKFWVFPVGMFGSSVSGDFAENFMSYIKDIFHHVYFLIYLSIYVDNFDNIVPPLPSGEPDWARARREWRLMLQVAKQLGIPVHDFVEPTLSWGTTVNGVEIESHLGWGGQTYPEPKAWLSEKRRSRFEGLVVMWADQTKFSLTEIAQIVGVTQSLEVVLKCLSGFLSNLIAWQTKCEQVFRREKYSARGTKIFVHKRVGKILHQMIEFLKIRNWSVPLVDWESCKSSALCVIFADAAAPKKLGLAYREAVWGKSAFCVYPCNIPHNDKYENAKFDEVKASKFFYAEKHSEELIKAAKRVTALSSPYLELENYVKCILDFVRKTNAKNVHLYGDCETALGWISDCVPKDTHAFELVSDLLEKQLELGFVLRATHVSNKHKYIKVVDKMSKGDYITTQEMEVNGFERMR